MKKILLVLLALIVVFSLTVITSAAPNKIVLRLGWWGNPTRDAQTVQVAKMYMAKNPNVTIETESTSWNGYWDKMAVQAAASNLPDIIQQDYSYISQYAEKNLLLDLTPYVKSKKIDLTNVPNSFISGGKVKNKLYGINLGTNAWAIIYDPAVLEKAGIAAPKPDWTWTDFEKISTEIFKKTGVQTQVFLPSNPIVMFENMVRQTGKSLYNPKNGTSLGFTDSKILISFYEIQLRLLKTGVLIKPDEAFVATTPQETPFAQGRAWLEYVWTNQVVAYATAAKRPIAIAVTPKITNSKRPGTYFKPAMFFSVSKMSANKDEAVKFVNYFINSIEANKVLLGERGIPMVPNVRTALKDIVDPVNRQIFDFIELVGNKLVSPIDPADPPGAGEVMKAFRNIDQEVLYGSTAPKDAAVKFMKQANEILAKNKTAQ